MVEVNSFHLKCINLGVVDRKKLRNKSLKFLKYYMHMSLLYISFVILRQT